MTEENTYDVLILGSGPSGVSAALPLLEAGLSVLMIDAGSGQIELGESFDHILARTSFINQWKWTVGENLEAFDNGKISSPKLRIPNHAKKIKNYLNYNKIQVANNIQIIGSTASGGLSNSWGCGVSIYSDADLKKFPIRNNDLLAHYNYIAQHIGVSGQSPDDLSDYFGLDGVALPPVKMDGRFEKVFNKYIEKRQKCQQEGFSLGRSRIAVLTSSKNGRNECNYCGSCLWQCGNGAMYNSSYDIRLLLKWPNYKYITNTIVNCIEKEPGGYSVVCTNGDRNESLIYKAKYIMIGLGTLATTRIAFKLLNFEKTVAVNSLPTAAFMLTAPSFSARKIYSNFGLGQLSYTLKLQEQDLFGSIFDTIGIPLSEFVKHSPLSKRNSYFILKALTRHSMVGNIFFPSIYSNISATLNKNGNLYVEGGYHSEIFGFSEHVKNKLCTVFNKIRHPMIPLTFKLATPGSDIHYASTIPMQKNPKLGDSTENGELIGAPGVYIIDGAALTTLSVKSHTLTIMANARRIATYLKNKILFEKNI